MFSHHLYSRIKSTKSQFISILLSDEELEFLQNFNIDFSKVHAPDTPDMYIINAEAIRQMFCHC